MSDSWSVINETLPLELAARTMAYKVEDNEYNCLTFVNNVYNDLEKTTELCGNWNMTVPKEIKFYINATWYGQNSNAYYY